MTVQPHEVFFKRPEIEYTKKADFDKAIAAIDQKMKCLDDAIAACMKLITVVEEKPQAEPAPILIDDEVQIKNKKK